MPRPVLLVLFAVYGSLLGSFANVVIWRVPRGESVVSPGSHCPGCGSAIRWYDNIPVASWLVLRGRCRDCRVAISPRYPAVEAASAALWLAAALMFGPGLQGLVAAVLFWTLLILAAIDLDTMRLPNVIVGPLAAFGFAAAAVSELSGLRLAPLVGLADSGVLSSPLLSALVGSVAAAGLSLGIATLYAGVRGRSGFGMGDVKLLAALGPFLGPYTLLVLVLGSVLGAVIGVAGAVVAREAVGGSKIPFGPFLAAGALIAAVWGPPLWSWYASLAGLA